MSFSSVTYVIASACPLNCVQTMTMCSPGVNFATYAATWGSIRALAVSVPACALKDMNSAYHSKLALRAGGASAAPAARALGAISNSPAAHTESEAATVARMSILLRGLVIFVLAELHPAFG